MARWVSCFLVGFVLLCFSGCSRGPSVTSGSAAKTPSNIPAIGDSAVYNLTSSVSASVVPKDMPQGTGRVVRRAVKSSNHGRTMPSYIVGTVDVHEEIDISLGGLKNSRTVITWYGYDASGNIYILGMAEDGVKWDVVTDTDPPLCTPCKIEPGTSWKYDAHLASGSTMSCSHTCLNKEQILTKIGTIQAYKHQAQINWSGLQLNGCTWFSPDIPFELRMDYYRIEAVLGVQVNVRMIYELEKLHLARGKH